MPCNRYTLFCLLVGKNLVLCSMYQNSSWFGPPCSVFQVTSPECRHWFVFFFLLNSFQCYLSDKWERMHPYSTKFLFAVFQVFSLPSFSPQRHSNVTLPKTQNIKCGLWYLAVIQTQYASEIEARVFVFLPAFLLGAGGEFSYFIMLVFYYYILNSLHFLFMIFNMKR